MKELLPNYIDGLTSKETDEDIKKHIADCESCRVIYENMIFDVQEKVKLKTIDSEKKVKAHLYQKKLLFFILICIVLYSVIVFARIYKIPLPFDANRMILTPVQAVRTLDDGSFALSTLDHLDFETSKEVISGKYNILNLMQFSYQGINNVGFISYSRTINRNGENVRVVFFCYYKTLWDIVLNGDLSEYSESGAAFGDIYDDSFQKDNSYIPGMKEIYYLPMRNLHKISEFSDEKLDEIRDESVLVWEGII